MQIKKLKLNNYKGFQLLDLSLDRNLTVIIGENGAGKSSILDVLDKLLSEITFNLNGTKRRTLSIDDININSTICYGNLLFKSKDQTLLEWTYKKSKNVFDKAFVHYITDLKPKNFKQLMRNSFGKAETDNEPTPLFLYFDSTSIPDEKDFIEWYKELVLFEKYLESGERKVDYSIKSAIESAIHKFTGIQFTTTIADNFKTIEPVFVKGDGYLKFSHLSDGEKKVIFIIGEIVRHFVVSFKSNRKQLLEFEGIVLIDEIEKHLHPKWQREIVPELINIFPKLQFIITTHALNIVANVARENIRILENFALKEYTPHTLGRDANSILYDVFKVEKRPELFKNKINNIYTLLEKSNFDKAKNELDLLINHLGDNDVEVKRIQAQIELLE